MCGYFAFSLWTEVDVAAGVGGGIMIAPGRNWDPGGGGRLGIIENGTVNEGLSLSGESRAFFFLDFLAERERDDYYDELWDYEYERERLSDFFLWLLSFLLSFTFFFDFLAYFDSERSLSLSLCFFFSPINLYYKLII